MGAKDFIKIALGLLISALLVSITFKVIKPSTESIGTNLTAMQDNMAQMNMTEFNDYDQRTLKGNEVQAAIKLYSNRDYAVIVQTLAGGTQYYNYCALLSGATTGSDTPTVSAGGVSEEAFKNNELKADLEADNDTGEIKHNRNLKNITAKNKKEYIRPTANFDAKLIHNDNGEIVGIAFRQQKEQ